MRTRILATLTFMSLFLTQSFLRAADIGTIRKGELTKVLTALQKHHPPSTDPDEQDDELPGWANPANREAVKEFILKYPETEEALLAEVWLIFAQGSFQRSRDAFESRAEELKKIISKTRRPVTAKIASLQRAFLLPADHPEFEKQTDEILAHIKEYESEKDKQFLCYIQIESLSPSDVEPELRRGLIIAECHRHQLGKALALAEELKQKCPQWSKRHNIDGNIAMLKDCRSPYPTLEDFKIERQSLSKP